MNDLSEVSAGGLVEPQEIDHRHAVAVTPDSKVDDGAIVTFGSAARGRRASTSTDRYWITT